MTTTSTNSNPVICIIPSGDTSNDVSTTSDRTRPGRKLCNDLYSLSPKPRPKEYVFKGHEEKNMLASIKTLSKLVSVSGLQLSLSLSDMPQLMEQASTRSPANLVSLSENQRWVITQPQCWHYSYSSSTSRSRSESMLDHGVALTTLDLSARSLSTWVAIGDNSVASELPSPSQV